MEVQVQVERAKAMSPKIGAKITRAISRSQKVPAGGLCTMAVPAISWRRSPRTCARNTKAGSRRPLCGPGLTFDFAQVTLSMAEG
jgi:hypothetical protein